MKAGDVGTLIWRSQRGVGGRVVGNRLPGHGIDNRVLRAGKRRLVDADVAEQVATSCTDVGDFEQQVMRERILKAGVVLMKVRRAQTAIKCTAGKAMPGTNAGIDLATAEGRKGLPNEPERPPDSANA